MPFGSKERNLSQESDDCYYLSWISCHQTRDKMKRSKYFYLTLFFLMLTNGLLAQNWLSRLENDEPVTRKNILKLDLLSPVYDMFNLELEQVRDSESSITYELLYQSIINDDYEFSKLGGRLHYRFYLGNQPAPKGIYVAAGAGAFKVDGLEKRIPSFVPGVGYSYLNKAASAFEVASFIWLGRQSVFKNRISIDYAMGTGYTFNPIDFNRANDWVSGRYAFYGNVRIGFLLGRAE